MPDVTKEQPNGTADKATITLPGVVEKIIPSFAPSEPEKAQIAVEGADALYREIRVENRLIDADGAEVALKVGAEVDVTIEAEPEDTHPAKGGKKHSSVDGDHTPKREN